MAIGTTANGGSLNSDGKSNTFTYDVFSRLQTGTANYAAGNYSQTYNYDPFGNVTNVSTTDPTGTYSSSISVDHQTNRVNAAGTSYDAAGNLTADSTSTSRRFDSLSIMTDKQGSSTEEFYVYTASDERIGVESRGGYWTWSFRDDTGKVLRQFQGLGCSQERHRRDRRDRRSGVEGARR